MDGVTIKMKVLLIDVDRSHIKDLTIPAFIL